MEDRNIFYSRLSIANELPVMEWGKDVRNSQNRWTESCLFNTTYSRDANVDILQWFGEALSKHMYRKCVYQGTILAFGETILGTKSCTYLVPWKTNHGFHFFVRFTNDFARCFPNGVIHGSSAEHKYRIIHCYVRKCDKHVHWKIEQNNHWRATWQPASSLGRVLFFTR